MKAEISSRDIIANTTGVDVFIDAHSHNVVEEEKVKDKSGKTVILTQAGPYLENYGVLTIDKNGKISTRLENDYEDSDERVKALEEDLIAKIEAKFGKKVAVLDNNLYAESPDSTNMTQSVELNLGDIVCDGVYWKINNDIDEDYCCDIVLQNIGGIRAGISAGDVILHDIKNSVPFENMICLITASGQQIKDALEMGVAGLDVNDANTWNSGFLQVAGMRYSVDTSIPDSVKTDEHNMFVKVDGEYRVKDIQVYNRDTGTYEDLDLTKQYKVGGVNYILRKSGCGLSMFKDCDVLIDRVGVDYEVFSDYINSFTLSNGYPKINTSNSPLSSYEGYLINYDDPYGSGRITFEK